jgi:diguanylate cyclase (GGDEF)-like protein
MLEEWDRHMLRELAHTDELTQLNNRRQFELIADQKIHQWPQYQSICLLMFDVDFFKRINDSHGHDIGDQVLQNIAEIARKEMRREDVLARFGGEEFVALLPETSLEDAMMIANRLRQKIESSTVYIGNNIQLHFTISIGVSRLDPKDVDLHLLIKEADVALYRAKQNGRNQVVCFDSLPN